ncbi:MAG TPA: hypothetical protein VMG12_38950 [Polyangiaceae bacterium]|nr:hypothetical protein [Polyangiaceae bacterium]
MAGDVRSPTRSARSHPARRSAGTVRLALAGVGGVLLLCTGIGAVIHPEAPPPFDALVRSDDVSSSVGEGRQFCGRHGSAVGHPGTWVIELSLDGREHCIVAYPQTERERLLFASLPAHPALTAWHEKASQTRGSSEASVVWQVESAAGMLVDYATRRAEAETALQHHRVRQALTFGVGLLASAGSVALGLRARGARHKTNPIGLA